MSTPQRRRPPFAYRNGRATVLREVLTHGERTIGDLAEATSLSRPTVGRIIDDLLDRGLLCDGTLRIPDTGRPARTLAAGSPRVGAVCAIELSPERLWAQSCTLTGQMLDQRSAPLHADHSTVDQLRDLLTTMREQSARDAHPIVHTVISVPGLVTTDGTVTRSNRIPSLDGVDLAALLDGAPALPGEERVTPVLIENDMSLRAIGEMLAGAALGAQSLVHFDLAAGFKPSVIVRGSAWHGAHSAIGENGTFFRAGVADEYTTIDGLTLHFNEIGLELDAGRLDERWARALENGLLRICLAFTFALDPEVIVIGGGEHSASAESLARIQRALDEACVFSAAPRVVAGRRSTEGNVIGALAMGIRAHLAAELDVADPPLPPLQQLSIQVHEPVWRPAAEDRPRAASQSAPLATLAAPPAAKATSTVLSDRP